LSYTYNEADEFVLKKGWARNMRRRSEERTYPASDYAPDQKAVKGPADAQSDARVKYRRKMAEGKRAREKQWIREQQKRLDIEAAEKARKLKIERSRPPPTTKEEMKLAVKRAAEAYEAETVEAERVWRLSFYKDL